MEGTLRWAGECCAGVTCVAATPCVPLAVRVAHKYRAWLARWHRASILRDDLAASLTYATSVMTGDRGERYTRCAWYGGCHHFASMRWRPQASVVHLCLDMRKEHSAWHKALARHQARHGQARASHRPSCCARHHSRACARLASRAHIGDDNATSSLNHDIAMKRGGAHDTPRGSVRARTRCLCTHHASSLRLSGGLLTTSMMVAGGRNDGHRGDVRGGRLVAHPHSHLDTAAHARIHALRNARIDDASRGGMRAPPQRRSRINIAGGVTVMFCTSTMRSRTHAAHSYARRGGSRNAHARRTSAQLILQLMASLAARRRTRLRAAAQATSSTRIASRRSSFMASAAAWLCLRTRGMAQWREMAMAYVALARLINALLVK